MHTEKKIYIYFLFYTYNPSNHLEIQNAALWQAEKVIPIPGTLSCVPSKSAVCCLFFLCFEIRFYSLVDGLNAAVYCVKDHVGFLQMFCTYHLYRPAHYFWTLYTWSGQRQSLRVRLEDCCYCNRMLEQNRFRTWCVCMCVYFLVPWGMSSGQWHFSVGCCFFFLNSYTSSYPLFGVAYKNVSHGTYIHSIDGDNVSKMSLSKTIKM